ncbi:hypothetical protein HPB51_002917 [Rhipicephalus microplus]|uniref:MAM domain-containing protein n=1 Tax=Rhipicephalus microplus TaxID=6941 RepID=A0A9J6DS31_RHIMP|nr:hypothetical protein HPB51_002917 [Rhipicephalus microplus]
MICLTAWYHMFGSRGFILRLSARKTVNSTIWQSSPLFYQYGRTTADMWYKVQRTINMDGFHNQLTFDTLMLPKAANDSVVALGPIEATPAACDVLTDGEGYCDFEFDECDWKSANGWRRQQKAIVFQDPLTFDTQMLPKAANDSVVALGPIEATPGACDVFTDGEGYCDFEFDECDWKSADGWRRQQKATVFQDPVRGSHSGPDSSAYVLMATRASSSPSGTLVTSPEFPGDTEPHCFEFWYQQTGGSGVELQVEVLANGKSEVVWKKPLKPLTNDWMLGRVQITQRKTFKTFAHLSLATTVQFIKGPETSPPGLVTTAEDIGVPDHTIKTLQGQYLLREHDGSRLAPPSLQSVHACSATNRSYVRHILVARAWCIKRAKRVQFYQRNGNERSAGFCQHLRGRGLVERADSYRIIPKQVEREETKFEVERAGSFDLLAQDHTTQSEDGDRSKTLDPGGIFSLPDGPKVVDQLVAGYFLLYKSSGNVGNHSIIKLREPSRYSCISFWYYLPVLRRGVGLYLNGEEMKVTDRAWKRQQLQFTKNLIITALSGSSNKGFVAIDDLLLSETPCDEMGRSPRMFDCGKNQTVPVEKVCDFVPDCKNAADEQRCGRCDFSESTCGWDIRGFGNRGFLAWHHAPIGKVPRSPRTGSDARRSGKFLESALHLT